MSQTTLDDDELFSEAASEMRADVEAALETARQALPTAEEVWDVDSDNVLGVLNALRSALDAGDARDSLRDAKKWYTMAERAGAFEDADDLREEMEALETVFEDLESAREQVSDLAATMPELRSELDELPSGADEDD